jgi:hypothetical protein
MDNFAVQGTHIKIMKGHLPFTSIIITGLWLFARPALAQLPGDHYYAGTDCLQAGSLPDPGIYVDDINLFSH